MRPTGVHRRGLQTIIDLTVISVGRLEDKQSRENEGYSVREVEEVTVTLFQNDLV